jgi:hypothetical protein
VLYGVALAGEQVRKVLLRRGFALEYATLAWNVAGIVVLAIGYVLVFYAAREVREIFLADRAAVS